MEAPCKLYMLSADNIACILAFLTPAETSSFTVSHALLTAFALTISAHVQSVQSTCNVFSSAAVGAYDQSVWEPHLTRWKVQLTDCLEMPTRLDIDFRTAVKRYIACFRLCRSLIITAADEPAPRAYILYACKSLPRICVRALLDLSRARTPNDPGTCLPVQNLTTAQRYWASEMLQNLNHHVCWCRMMILLQSCGTPADAGAVRPEVPLGAGGPHTSASSSDARIMPSRPPRMEDGFFVLAAWRDPAVSVALLDEALCSLAERVRWRLGLQDCTAHAHHAQQPLGARTRVGKAKRPRPFPSAFVSMSDTTGQLDTNACEAAALASQATLAQTHGAGLLEHEHAEHQAGLPQTGPITWPAAYVLDTISSVLFGPPEALGLGLDGDHETFAAAANSFLGDVLRRRKGLPIALCALYSAVAARVGLGIGEHVVPIGTPGRFLLGFCPPSATGGAGEGAATFFTGERTRTGRPICISRPDDLYIDCFEKGALLRSEQVVQMLMQMGAPHPRSEAHRRVADVRSVWGRMCNNLSQAWAELRVPPVRVARLLSEPVPVASDEGARHRRMLALEPFLVDAELEDITGSFERAALQLYQHYIHYHTVPRHRSDVDHFPTPDGISTVALKIAALNEWSSGWQRRMDEGRNGSPLRAPGLSSLLALHKFFRRVVTPSVQLQLPVRDMCFAGQSFPSLAFLTTQPSITDTPQWAAALAGVSPLSDAVRLLFVIEDTAPYSGGRPPSVEQFTSRVDLATGLRIQHPLLADQQDRFTPLQPPASRSEVLRLMSVDPDLPRRKCSFFIGQLLMSSVSSCPGVVVVVGMHVRGSTDMPPTLLYSDLDDQSGRPNHPGAADLLLHMLQEVTPSEAVAHSLTFDAHSLLDLRPDMRPYHSTLDIRCARSFVVEKIDRFCSPALFKSSRGGQTLALGSVQDQWANDEYATVASLLHGLGPVSKVRDAPAAWRWPLNAGATDACMSNVLVSDRNILRFFSHAVVIHFRDTASRDMASRSARPVPVSGLMVDLWSGERTELVSTLARSTSEPPAVQHKEYKLTAVYVPHADIAALYPEDCAPARDLLARCTQLQG